MLTFSLPKPRLDVVLLVIVFPLISKAKFSLSRKIALGVLLCGGVFTILISILNNVMAMLYTQDLIHGILGHRLMNWGADFTAWILAWGIRETVCSLSDAFTFVFHHFC